jgi:L-fuconolactonase
MKTDTSRRTFLQASLAGIVGGALASRGGAARDPIIQPAMIIDTHTHFYDPTRPEGVPWPPKNDPLLYRRVLPEEYRQLPKPQPVNGTVVVEASAWVEDNQWILDLAADDPFIVGFVGNLPAGTEAFRGHFEHFARNRLFRGIRVHGNRAREGVEQPEFLASLKQVAEADRSLDVVGSPVMLPAIARLAEAIPNLRVIIDHVAGVRIDGKTRRIQMNHATRGIPAQKINAITLGSGTTETSEENSE